MMNKIWMVCVALAGVCVAGGVLADPPPNPEGVDYLLEGSGSGFDSGRFGDPVTPAQATSGGINTGSGGFDFGRFGDAVTPVKATVGGGNFGGEQTGGVPVRPVQSVRVGPDGTITGATAKPAATATGDVASKTTDKVKPVSKATGDVASKTTDKVKPVDTAKAGEKVSSEKMCGQSSAAAGKLSTDDAALEEGIKSDNMQATPACKKAMKAMFSACAKQDKAAFDKAKDEGNKACEKELKEVDVSEKNPQGNAGNPDQTNAVEERRNAYEQVFGNPNGVTTNTDLASGFAGLGSLASPGNLMQAMMLVQAMKQQQGSSESSGGSLETGSSLGSSGDSWLAETSAKCDKVASTATTTGNDVIMGVTVTTTTTKETCQNGYVRTTTKTAAVDANGKRSEKVTVTMEPGSSATTGTAGTASSPLVRRVVPCGIWPETDGLQACFVEVEEKLGDCGYSGEGGAAVFKDCDALHSVLTRKFGVDASGNVVKIKAEGFIGEGTKMVQVGVPCEQAAANGQTMAACYRNVPEAMKDMCGYQLRQDGMEQKQVFLDCPALW